MLIIESLTKNIILFDLDGTITDPKTGITKSVCYALKEFGIYVEDLDDLCKFIGPPLKDSFMRFYGFGELEACMAVDKYREYFREVGIYENELYGGIEELLKRLSAYGKQLIIATSKPKVFADRILEYFDIFRYFRFVSGSELDGTRVRKGEVIRFALEETGVHGLDNVVMVGDREYDIFGAKEAGIDSIGVLYGYGSYKELKEAGASLIVGTVGDLQKALA